jgi:hypothetical protein
MLGVAGVALRAAGRAWPQPSADPISRWELDETSTAEGVFEDRGSAHVLMIHVGTWADLTTASLIEGAGGTSAFTDGSAYATMPANVAAHSLAALTISFYYQRVSAANKQILLAAGDGGQIGDFSIEVLADGRLRAWHTGQDQVLRFFDDTSGITGTNLQVGTAHRIDLSLGPQGARIYLDGAELVAAAIPENLNGWNNTRVKYLGRWTDGVQAPAVGLFDRLRIWNRQLSSVEIAELQPPRASTTSSPPPASHECLSSGAGTLVDLGDADDRESTTFLIAGGNARYDASGIIARTRWTGSQGCSGPNRSATTEQFLFRWNADHDGGCICGGTVYGNVTPDDNYDAGDGKSWALYPCSDGGQLYVRRQGGSLQNFTIEGWRFHAVWDPVRLSKTGSEVTDHITVKGCWATCVRDDFIENDTGCNMVVEECLVGDTIGQNVGCWVLYSTSGGNGFDNIVKFKNCLIWSSHMKANRIRAVNGYACGSLFKVDRQRCPRIHIHDTVIMADGANISTNNGDPLGLLKAGPSAPAPLVESSGNFLIWRDRGNLGSYQSNFGDVPPGFTLLTGSEGESFWNERVAAWKTAHPHVRRLNKTGIVRPFLGGTTSVADQG